MAPHDWYEDARARIRSRWPGREHTAAAVLAAVSPRLRVEVARKIAECVMAAGAPSRHWLRGMRANIRRALAGEPLSGPKVEAFRRATQLGSVYRLGIGRKLSDVSLALKGEGVEGATLIPAVGYWRGESEETTVVELAGWAPDAVNALAYRLAVQLHQEAVYVSDGLSAHLVWGEKGGVAA